MIWLEIAAAGCVVGFVVKKSHDLWVGLSGILESVFGLRNENAELAQLTDAEWAIAHSAGAGRRRARLSFGWSEAIEAEERDQSNGR